MGELHRRKRQRDFPPHGLGNSSARFSHHKHSSVTQINPSGVEYCRVKAEISGGSSSLTAHEGHVETFLLTAFAIPRQCSKHAQKNFDLAKCETKLGGQVEKFIAASDERMERLSSSRRRQPLSVTSIAFICVTNEIQSVGLAL